MMVVIPVFTADISIALRQITAWIAVLCVVPDSAVGRNGPDMVLSTFAYVGRMTETTILKQAASCQAKNGAVCEESHKFQVTVA